MHGETMKNGHQVRTELSNS